MNNIQTITPRPVQDEPGTALGSPVDLKGLQASIAVKAAGEAMKVASKVMAARAVPRDMRAIEENLLGYNYTDENGNIVHEPGKCDQLIFADECLYAKPKGGTVIEGLSHWFAKYLASIWGNFEWESIEHSKSQADKQTQIQVVVWDIEKNSTHTETVIVLHKQAGTDKDALSSDDIRQEVNRQKSILERNTLLDCFPKDLTQRCFERILETLDREQSEALKDPKKSIEVFAKKLDVEPGRVYGFLKIGKPEQLKAAHLRRLAAVLKGIKAGELEVKKLFSATATVDLASIENAAPAEEPAKEKPKGKKAEKADKEKEPPAPPAEQAQPAAPPAPPAEPEPQPESKSLPTPPASTSADLLPEDEF